MIVFKQRMQITALSFIKTIHTIQILIETKDTLPFLPNNYNLKAN